MITKSCAYYDSVFVVLVSSGLSSLIPKHGHLTVRAWRYFGWFNAKTTGLKQHAVFAPIDGIWATNGVTWKCWNAVYNSWNSKQIELC